MVGYNVGRRCRSGPGERKLGQLSTDESNRRSPHGSSFGLLEANSLLIYDARSEERSALAHLDRTRSIFDEVRYYFSHVNTIINIST